MYVILKMGLTYAIKSRCKMSQLRELKPLKRVLINILCRVLETLSSICAWLSSGTLSYLAVYIRYTQEILSSTPAFSCRRVRCMGLGFCQRLPKSTDTGNNYGGFQTGNRRISDSMWKIDANFVGYTFLPVANLSGIDIEFAPYTENTRWRLPVNACGCQCGLPAIPKTK